MKWNDIFDDSLILSEEEETKMKEFSKAPMFYAVAKTHALPNPCGGLSYSDICDYDSTPSWNIIEIKPSEIDFDSDEDLYVLTEDPFGVDSDRCELDEDIELFNDKKEAYRYYYEMQLKDKREELKKLEEVVKTLEAHLKENS